ncbi:uncharacterized protein [Salvelinus sp. IW2-2015]|uniref:uncharacterized protein isoform X2 n=1 Tax=Salvelinus sp. IW2-2015 TaxID=2691554 RepID=UPI0038D391F8
MTSKRPHNRRPRVTTPAQDLHTWLLHLRDRLRPATRTADEIVGLNKLRISDCQTVRNPLREAHLRACHPLQGLDVTAVRCRNQLQWANAHLRWPLARWRGVLFTDESLFQLYQADGRQRVWHHVAAEQYNTNRPSHTIPESYAQSSKYHPKDLEEDLPPLPPRTQFLTSYPEIESYENLAELPYNVKVDNEAPPPYHHTETEVCQDVCHDSISEDYDDIGADCQTAEQYNTNCPSHTIPESYAQSSKYHPKDLKDDLTPLPPRTQFLTSYPKIENCENFAELPYNVKVDNEAPPPYHHTETVVCQDVCHDRDSISEDYDDIGANCQSEEDYDDVG